MVAVKVAITDPKLNFPRTYWVITIIAPPHPGKAPKNDARTISK